MPVSVLLELSFPTPSSEAEKVANHLATGLTTFLLATHFILISPRFKYYFPGKMPQWLIEKAKEMQEKSVD